MLEDARVEWLESATSTDKWRDIKYKLRTWEKATRQNVFYAMNMRLFIWSTF